MTQLAIQYPIKYRSIFESLTDFEVIDLNAPGVPVGYTWESNKSIWLDFSVLGSVLRYDEKDYVGIILPTYPKPAENLFKIIKHQMEGKFNIGVWRGSKKFLTLLEDSTDVVAIPWYMPGRTLLLEKDSWLRYHYYGFCNLEELKKYPPASLHTSIPITAALMGIDLRDRERRPKKLGTFRYDLTMNNAQIDLALTNIQAIKEALSK